MLKEDSMQVEVFNLPDETALWKLLEENPHKLSTVAIYLAWREGLSRKEIWNLRWEQLDYEAGFLRLPDRNVPLEDKTARALQQWHTALGVKREVPYVASGLRNRKQVAEQYLSRITRDALDSVGQSDVRLIDLRHDFVRRNLEKYDWLYVIQISGLSVSTYRNQFSGKVQRDLPMAPPETPIEDEVGILLGILEQNRSGAAGIGLWLSQQANLTQDEIVNLTWDQVDLDKGLLHLKRGDIFMIKEVIDVLKDEKDRRSAEDDPHVILTPKSRKPMDKARLSTIMRDFLVKGGLANYHTDTLRYSAQIQKEREKILRQARLQGKITRSEVEELLGVKTTVAYTRLCDLVESGDLVMTSKGYFPADRAVPQDRWADVVLQAAAENGSVTVSGTAELLHTGKYSARRLLRRMTASGELVTIRNTQKYILPKAPG